MAAKKEIPKKDLFKLVLFAIALAMGVVSIVLSIVGEFTGEFENTGILLGIGVFCLVLVGVKSITKSQ